MTDPKTRERKRLPAPIYGIAKKRREAGKSQQAIEWERYLIPGTNTLRNKFGTSPRSYGIVDPVKLDDIETFYSISRLHELQEHPIEGNFDFDHMRAIHQYLFQDVYDWAGQPRTVGLVKMGHAYGSPYEVKSRWEHEAQTLQQSNLLRGETDQNQFSTKLAQSWGAINYAHAFREGNTRSQTLFFWQLAQQAGWDLDTTRLDPQHPQSLRDDFIDARFAFQDSYNMTGYGNARELSEVLNQTISPTPQKQLEIQAQSKPRHAVSDFEFPGQDSTTTSRSDLQSRLEESTRRIEDDVAALKRNDDPGLGYQH